MSEERPLPTDGQEPSPEDTTSPEGATGQEPAPSAKPPEGKGQSNSGEIDLDALPEEVRQVVEGLLEKVRKANREARNLRKRLKALQRDEANVEARAEDGEADDEKVALQQRLAEAERRAAELQQRLQEYELAQVVRERALAAGFRPEAVDEVAALVRVKLGEQVFGEGGIDTDELDDFLADLKKAKPYLLKPKATRKPQPKARQRKDEDEGSDADAMLAEVKARFGL